MNDEPIFLNQAAAAELLGVSPNTLAFWRQRKLGPPHLQIGRHVRYDREALIAWARDQRPVPA